MTCIAYDHKTKTLAVDSQFTSGGDRISYGEKFNVGENYVAVFAGDTISGHKALALLKAGESPTVALIEKCTVVIMYTRGRKAGQVYVYDDASEPRRVKRIDAWGSGSDYAVGALSAGASAYEAVQIACHYSATCGGKIHTFNSER